MLSLNISIILFYILERLLELVVSARNKALLKKDHNLKVLNKNEALQMKIFHTLWFCMLLIESTPAKVLTGNMFYLTIALLVGAQALRWSAIFTLGKYWSVDVYEMHSHAVINSGPYVYMKHPNYLAVILEFLFLPLLLGCPWTLVIGSLMNLFVLKRRINMEESALLEQRGDYDKKFAGKGRFGLKI